jgi:hypothetical protein
MLFLSLSSLFLVEVASLFLVEVACFQAIPASFATVLA